jgi:hypothetical protein
MLAGPRHAGALRADLDDPAVIYRILAHLSGLLFALLS